MKSTYFILGILFFLCKISTAQPLKNDADSLRGFLNENRNWFNVKQYTIYVKPNINKKSIEGTVEIYFDVEKEATKMQIDLQSPMVIDEVIYEKNKLPFNQLKNIALIQFPAFKNKQNQVIKIKYHGIPKEAIRPPWDGGWIWQKDSLNRPFVSVACQGLGASVWYPCKDHQSDEPENGAILSIEVPNKLMAIGNGRLIKTTKKDTNNIFTWQVKNPINNYNIIPYIGNYVNWTDTFMGEKGKLDLSYWTLDYEKSKAEIHFQDVKKMLRAFEYWFGPYPFYEDGYKLVQAPHLGMEHQSSIAYGNKFRKGYLGRDLSNTGWGIKWDYIIVHESGHEWFANNITTNDIADMWVHEGFTTYSEALFVDYYFGSKAANEYVVGVRKGIKNDIPIIGKYNVNQEGSGDMYPKGANILQTIRNSVKNDALFRNCLRKLNEHFYHSTTTTAEVEKFISNFLQYDYSLFFDQYLRTNKIPTLHYLWDESKQTLYLQFQQCVKGFNMPLFINGNKVIVDDNKVQSIKIMDKNLDEILKNLTQQYYLNIKN